MYIGHYFLPIAYVIFILTKRLVPVDKAFQNIAILPVVYFDKDQSKTEPFIFKNVTCFDCSNDPICVKAYTYKSPKCKHPPLRVVTFSNKRVSQDNFAKRDNICIMNN